MVVAGKPRETQEIIGPSGLQVVNVLDVERLLKLPGYELVPEATAEEKAAMAAEEAGSAAEKLRSALELAEKVEADAKAEQERLAWSDPVEDEDEEEEEEEEGLGEED